MRELLNLHLQGQGIYIFLHHDFADIAPGSKRRRYRHISIEVVTSKGAGASTRKERVSMAITPGYNRRLDEAFGNAGKELGQ